MNERSEPVQTSSQTSPPLGEGDKLLDAAREQFCLLGIRRSSMEDVARRAGIGRATLYRRFENKDALVAALMLREIGQMVATIESAMAVVSDPEERVVEAFVVGIRLTRGQPLLRALLSTEAESILPALTLDAGAQLAIVRKALAEQVRRARVAVGVDGHALADAEHVAEFVARVAHSLSLSPETSLPIHEDEQAREFARLAVVPLVFGCGSGRAGEKRCA